MVLRVFIFLALQHYLLQSQNLVKDGSFEAFSSCPEYLTKTKLNCLKYWGQGNKNTPDYYNQCSKFMGIPKNVSGYQLAYHGTGYVGIICYDRINKKYREIIESVLIKPLLKDSIYFVKFHTTLANNHILATTGLKASFIGNNKRYNTINLNDSIAIIDTLNWQVLKCIYKANGGEKKIQIGNTERWNKIKKHPIKIFSGILSYYYLDAAYIVGVNKPLLLKINKNDSIQIFEDFFTKFNPSLFNVSVKIDSISTHNNKRQLGNFLPWMIENPLIELTINCHPNFIKNANRVVEYFTSQKISDLRMNIVPDNSLLYSNELKFSFRSLVNEEDVKQYLIQCNAN